MMKIKTILVAALYAFVPASASAASISVKITDLGTPVCAQRNPQPDWTHLWYGNDLHGFADILPDAWTRWPHWAGKAFYSALWVVNNEPTSALWRFDRRTGVTFVVGNPQPYDFFTFLKKNGSGQLTPIAQISGADIVASLGPTPTNDYFISLDLVGGAFDALGVEIRGPNASFISIANLNVVCAPMVR